MKLSRDFGLPVLFLNDFYVLQSEPFKLHRLCAISHTKILSPSAWPKWSKGQRFFFTCLWKWGFLICSDGKSASLNKLSKAMRDSPRRLFLNSTTQDRTPWDDLSRLLAALILDRVSGTLPSTCLMSLIARIVRVRVRVRYV